MEDIAHLPFPALGEFRGGSPNSQIRWPPPYVGKHSFRDFGNLTCGSRSQASANNARNNLRVWLSCDKEHIDDSDQVHGLSWAFVELKHAVASSDGSLEVLTNFESLSRRIYVRLKNQGPGQRSSCSIDVSLEAFVAVYVKTGNTVKLAGSYTKELLTPIAGSGWMPPDRKTGPHPGNVIIQPTAFETRATIQLPTSRDQTVVFRTGLHSKLSAWLNDVEITSTSVAAGVVPMVVSRSL